jgi:protein gp37
MGKPGWWWDKTWNPVGGCKAISPGCTHCYAAQIAGTYSWPLQKETLHTDVTLTKGRRRIFNGELTELRPGHRLWTMPLEWRGAEHPALGSGQPSLIFVGDMSDLFHEDRPAAVIDRVVATIAASEHVGLSVTKRTQRMAEYFSTRHRGKNKIWLGFSAERQQEFGQRWADMKPLAEAGWLVFVSVAPMIGPVTLPPDFLRLARWVIVAGEQGPHDLIRDMHPDWARAIRDQCAAANMPFFMKQMSHGKPIPPDLQIRQFPS